MSNRILLVEDDPTSRVLIAQMLTEMGNGVTSAASGEEALQYLCGDASYDLVVSDVVMGGMSGVELAQRTRDARPGIPLILMTGVPNAVDEAIAAGILPLPKPVTRARIATIIADALSR